MKFMFFARGNSEPVVKKVLRTECVFECHLCKEIIIIIIIIINYYYYYYYNYYYYYYYHCLL